jgi:hypothetical protein
VNRDLHPWLFLFGVFLAIALLGCATSSPRKFAYAGQAADVVMTGVALCNDHGLQELNPILTLAGEECWQVVASSALVKGAFLAILRATCPADRCGAAYRVVGAFGFGAAAYTWGQIP